jgi:hypothetical protein
MLVARSRHHGTAHDVLIEMLASLDFDPESLRSFSADDTCYADAVSPAS